MDSACVNNKITVIGTVFMDIKGFSFNEYNPIGTNIGNIEFINGGVGRNTAVNIANIGLPVSFVSTADFGGTGDSVISELNDCGIDTTFVLRTESNGIGMWLAILNESGELVGSISKQPDFPAFKSHIDNVIDDILRTSRAIVLEMDITEEIAETVILKAASANIPIYVIVGNMSVVLKRKDLLAKTKCFICNNIEAGKLADINLENASSEEICSLIKNITDINAINSMVITNGAEGSVYYDGKTVGIIPAVETEVVDTTGAGDAYFSGTVGSLINGISLEESCRKGALLASKVIASTKSCIG